MADDSKLRTVRNAWCCLKAAKKMKNRRRSPRRLGLRGKHSEGDNKEVG